MSVASSSSSGAGHGGAMFGRERRRGMVLQREDPAASLVPAAAKFEQAAADDGAALSSAEDEGVGSHLIMPTRQASGAWCCGFAPRLLFKVEQIREQQAQAHEISLSVGKRVDVHVQRMSDSGSGGRLLMRQAEEINGVLNRRIDAITTESMKEQDSISKLAAWHAAFRPLSVRPNSGNAKGGGGGDAEGGGGEGEGEGGSWESMLRKNQTTFNRAKTVMVSASDSHKTAQNSLEQTREEYNDARKKHGQLTGLLEEAERSFAAAVVSDGELRHELEFEKGREQAVAQEVFLLTQKAAGAKKRLDQAINGFAKEITDTSEEDKAVEHAEAVAAVHAQRGELLAKYGGDVREAQIAEAKRKASEQQLLAMAEQLAELRKAFQEQHAATRSALEQQLERNQSAADAAAGAKADAAASASASQEVRAGLQRQNALTWVAEEELAVARALPAVKLPPLQERDGATNTQREFEDFLAGHPRGVASSSSATEVESDPWAANAPLQLLPKLVAPEAPAAAPKKKKKKKEKKTKVAEAEPKAPQPLAGTPTTKGEGEGEGNVATPAPAAGPPTPHAPPASGWVTAAGKRRAALLLEVMTRPTERHLAASVPKKQAHPMARHVASRNQLQHARHDLRAASLLVGSACAHHAAARALPTKTSVHTLTPFWGL